MKNNKKLTIIISSYDDITNPHYSGGGAVAIHELAKRLSSKYNLKILSWNHTGKLKETIQGVKYERVGFKAVNPKLAMLIFQLALPLLGIFKKYDLWIESFAPPFTTSFLPVFTKKPIVGVVHMLAAEDMQRKYKLPFFIVENLGIKKYKNIIVPSQLLKDKLSKINQTSSITTISNGINHIVQKNLPRKNYILFLGRIEIDQKGIDLLLESFKIFNETKQNTFSLVIAGSGVEKEVTKLKKMIEKLEISKYVKLTGKVTGKKKTDLLTKASCIVIPSRFETYSIVALEAMAAGLPIVCFKIDGLSWIPDTVAKKVSPFNIDKLSKAISLTVTDSSMVYNIKKAGKKYAGKFTWDAVAKLYEKLINSIATNL